MLKKKYFAGTKEEKKGIDIMTWKQAAFIAAMIYGCFVNYKEGFFICPKCGEPIYACDWYGHDFSTCPVCEFKMEEE